MICGVQDSECTHAAISAAFTTKRRDVQTAGTVRDR